MVLPDSKQVSENLGWDKPIDLICFSNNFKNLGSFVKVRMGTKDPISGNEQPLTTAGVTFFDNLLAKKFTLELSLTRILE